MAVAWQAVKRPEDRQQSSQATAVQYNVVPCPLRVCQGMIKNCSSSHERHAPLLDNLPRGEMQYLQDSAQHIQGGLHCKRLGELAHCRLHVTQCNTGGASSNPVDGSPNCSG